MKFIIPFVLVTTLLISFSPVLATDKENIKISGTVVDSLTQQPVEFANVALMKAGTTTPIDGTVCDADGKFTLKVMPGDYQLSISFIGFETYTINIHAKEKNDVNLGNIVISPTQHVLDEITIEGQKAVIEERVDRTVYNAENDQTAKGGDATDVLKRAPMLSVDLDGNVSLRGNQNIMVLINNKPSSIMAGNVADALKQIPADQIKSVEVITSPSAKYDAEGSAGIINIITKKNTLEGATLNVDAGIGLRGSNLGLNGNFRRGKMGFSLGGWGRANYNVQGNFTNERTIGDATITQSADTRNQGLFGHYNFGWDYDIDKKNALAASVRFGVRNFSRWQDGLTSQNFFDGDLVNESIADVVSDDRSNNVDANLTYTHYYDKPQREFSLQGLFSRNNGNSEFESIYKSVMSPDPLPANLLNVNDSYNQEVTVQADYVTPIQDNQMLEFGAKNIMRKVESDFQLFTSVDGAYEPVVASDLTNNLDYDQNVMAGYLSYTYSTKNGYSLKAGSRYEYTTISAYTKTQSEDEFKIPSYGLLVPSVNVSKKLSNGNTLKASYNKRIQRPSIRFLNPNIQPQNDLNITQGNPLLSPEYTNNYELSYSTLIKGTMLNISTFVRTTSDAIQSVRDIITYEDREVTRTTYANIGRENAYGASIFANVNIGKLSLNGGTDVYYASLDNNSNDPLLHAANEGWVASGRVFGNYNLNKGWGLQFFSFYRGRQVQLQGSQDGFYMYSLAVKKEFNEKRGSIGLGFENFLQSSIKMKSRLETPHLSQMSVNEMFNSSIRLNVSYRIGKMKVDSPPRRRRSINNDDLKDGGGDNMMGGNESQQRGGGMPSFGGNKRRTQAAVQDPQQALRDSSATDTVQYDVTGSWKFAIESPQHGEGMIMLSKTETGYTGTIKTARMPQDTPLENITVNDNEVSFSYNVSSGGNQRTVIVHYVVSEHTLHGKITFGPDRVLNINGSRKQ
ncbi:MAG TPA: TonB-dependent receptor [Chryseosolibacter sp.]|nr:TonB-dependent receptor [Chryseosolibacter sp.]